MITIRVPLAERGYDVIVGRGARHEVASLLPSTAKRAVIVTQAGIPLDIDPGLPNQVLRIGAGEEHKSLATIETLARGFARFGLTRNDVVIAVGGGMVTDVGGFAAATWHRGVPVVNVSTTLLGMVDAAIGGKTAVNLPAVDGIGGKNLIGAFWQPSGVVCDLDALTTLSPRELRCGRGEMAKYHFLTGDDLLAMDEPQRIARCVQIKADIVAGDERESGGRALLNYGHTLAHALEIATDYSLAHGEAVAIGLVYAAHLAHRLGRIDDQRVAHHYDVVGGSYELDTALPADVDPARLIELMARDKKALDGGLTFVLDGPNGVELVDHVPADAARDALDAMSHQ
ncbi:MAG TPA: 3-dehydroquinate synthase family protein [Ilumatobacteraceae bacterium]|nr:3-dehydroquinate synthase family protein [Ilumatobacteraceae bacterium]